MNMENSNKKKNTKLDKETQEKLDSMMDSFLALNSLISNTDPDEKIVENTIELSDSYVDLISNSTVLSKEEISNILSKIDKRLINQEMVQQLARKSTDIESAKRLLKAEINRMKEEDNSDYTR